MHRVSKSIDSMHGAVCSARFVSHSLPPLEICIECGTDASQQHPSRFHCIALRSFFFSDEHVECMSVRLARTWYTQQSVPIKPKYDIGTTRTTTKATTTTAKSSDAWLSIVKQFSNKIIKTKSHQAGIQSNSPTFKCDRSSR